MDPFSLMATATAAFNGIKAAVKVGQEIEGVYRQLSKWADAAGQLQQLINDSKNDQGEKKKRNEKWRRHLLENVWQGLKYQPAA